LTTLLPLAVAVVAVELEGLTLLLEETAALVVVVLRQTAAVRWLGAQEIRQMSAHLKATMAATVV
jgi:hypothetical protein